jgi:hypothetical protein
MLNPRVGRDSSKGFWAVVFLLFGYCVGAQQTPVLNVMWNDHPLCFVLKSLLVPDSFPAAHLNVSCFANAEWHRMLDTGSALEEFDIVIFDRFLSFSFRSRFFLVFTLFFFFFFFSLHLGGLVETGHLLDVSDIVLQANLVQDTLSQVCWLHIFFSLPLRVHCTLVRLPGAPFLL